MQLSVWAKAIAFAAFLSGCAHHAPPLSSSPKAGHQAARAEVLLISEPLGLVDVVVETPRGSDVRSVLIDIPGGRPVEAVPLGSEPVITGGTVWVARLIRGTPSAPPLTNLSARLGLADGSEQRIESIPLSARACTQTPDWAKGATWSQIFPERFRNGNPGNDPRSPDSLLLPWTAPWQDVGDEELAATVGAGARGPGAASDQLTSKERFEAVVSRRRYGGDLQGVVEKLDEIRELGVTAIYLNPIFRAPSLHKYDTADFRHVDESLAAPGNDGAVSSQDSETLDPKTWNWTAADRFFLDQLIPAMHSRGMRIVLDGVWNHSGREFWAFQDVRRRGFESPFRDWYFAQFAPPGDARAGQLLAWRAWDGPSGWLPQFRQSDDGDLVDPVKRHIFDVTRRWMAPGGDVSRGIDGWRLDVPDKIGAPFWRSWREHAKRINPEAILVGEYWEPAGSSLGPSGFDAQMNYPFARAVTAWLGTKPGFTSAQLAADLEAAASGDPAIELVQWNLLDSHDTDRTASMLHNPGFKYDSGAPPGDGGYKGDRPPREVFERVMMGVAIQATYVGSPMIYAGDELGMFGADDPHNRKPLPWLDLGPMTDPEDAPEFGLRDQFRGYLQLRHDPRAGPVLRFGLVRHLSTAWPDVFAFERRLNGTAVRIIANRASATLDADALLQTFDPAPQRWRRLDRGARNEVRSRSVGVWVSEN
jgi:cyclomaltodextrinase / maltogenic alpha-amylase / neopullulanase